MTYHILTQRGTVISYSTVQRVTNLELSTDPVIAIFKQFDDKIAQKFKTGNMGYISDKLNPEDWVDLLTEDLDFCNEFEKICNNDAIKEADDYTAETLDDTYINVEIVLPCDSEGPDYTKVTKRLRDANGIPIGTVHDNPISDLRLYEVKYLDDHTVSLIANTIAENLYSQVDEEGNCYVLFDTILDHRVDGIEIKINDSFINSSNGGRRRKQTTKGWEILIQWKDGFSSWEHLKDMKETYSVQLAEYAL